LKEITTNHTYTTEEVREMVKRRTKAAVASGKQNIAQFRLELMNDIEVKKSKLEAAQSKLDRLRSNPSASSAQMEHVEDEVASLEKALLALEEDRRQIDLHAAKSAMKYNAADKLGNVNDRNRSRNVVVDGEDSRLTLQEEFMGTGDSRNDIFRKQRTKINDLWKTTDKNKSKSGAKGEEDHHAEVVSKVFRNSSLRDKGQKATVKASDMKKSITGLMRSSSDQPRKRIGISLQAYLEKARSSQQQNQ
jgi:hypothetical protein